MVGTENSKPRAKKCTQSLGASGRLPLCWERSGSQREEQTICWCGAVRRSVWGFKQPVLPIEGAGLVGRQWILIIKGQMILTSIHSDKSGCWLERAIYVPLCLD